MRNGEMFPEPIRGHGSVSLHIQAGAWQNYLGTYLLFGVLRMLRALQVTVKSQSIIDSDAPVSGTVLPLK